MLSSTLISTLLCANLSGCHDLVGTQALPSGTQDPSYYNNATGALGMRNTALYNMSLALPSYIVTTGQLTDELTDVSLLTNSAGGTVANAGQIQNPLDERILPEVAYGSSGGYPSDGTYSKLQLSRNSLLQAILQLATYDTSAKDTAVLKPAAGRALRGELYALYGYTEIMLADFFCSGIPLSTIDFQKDFTYRTGSSRDSVYRDAIGKLDTAFALSADSIRIQNLARVGLGRVYLDLGNFTAAADDVGTVSDGYTYQITSNWIFTSGAAPINLINQVATVSNQEGIYGLPYLSSSDPRTADTTVTIGLSNGNQLAVGFPRVYLAALNGNGNAQVTIASAVEARLIQAEAALQSHDVTTWLNTLNELRTSGSLAGTGGVPGLAPLPDPGANSSNPDSARVALTFQERAYWLYLTGHRQGDLRRQLRQYTQYWHGDQSKVYPSGPYLALGAGTYGADVTAPIPQSEYVNPLFHGCLNREP